MVGKSARKAPPTESAGTPFTLFGTFFHLLKGAIAGEYDSREYPGRQDGDPRYNGYVYRLHCPPLGCKLFFLSMPCLLSKHPLLHLFICNILLDSLESLQHESPSYSTPRIPPGAEGGGSFGQEVGARATEHDGILGKWDGFLLEPKHTVETARFSCPIEEIPPRCDPPPLC
jgi:hypothetical protein